MKTTNQFSTTPHHTYFNNPTDYIIERIENLKSRLQEGFASEHVEYDDILTEQYPVESIPIFKVNENLKKERDSKEHLSPKHPFNYEWAWNNSSGSPEHLHLSVNKNAGNMYFFVHTNSKQPSWGRSIRTAMGLNYTPYDNSSLVHILAKPKLTYNWWNTCTLAGAKTNAFIGLHVARYNKLGVFDGTELSIKKSLWNNQSWLFESGGNQTNLEFPIEANFNADKNFNYILWVWCGGMASANGRRMISQSCAGASISVALPSLEINSLSNN